MALNDDIALLSIVPLFRDISEDKLRLIAFGAERRRIQPGQMLFREGTPADCAFASTEIIWSAKTRASNTRSRQRGLIFGWIPW